MQKLDVTHLRTQAPTEHQIDAVCAAIDPDFPSKPALSQHFARDNARRWWNAVAQAIEPPAKLIGWRDTSGGTTIYADEAEARQRFGDRVEAVFTGAPKPRAPAADSGVAHHGPPVLTERDMKICLAMVEWIRLVRGLNRSDYPKHWLPSFADLCKSRLFWRLRSGKKPLPEPPPTAFSCPWYEVVDEADRAHWAYEMHEYEGKCFVAQCPYTILERDEGGVPSVIGYGSYRFTLRSGQSPYGGSHSGWWIQLQTAPTVAAG